MSKLAAMIAMLIGGFFHNMANAQLTSNDRGHFSHWHAAGSVTFKNTIDVSRFHGRFRVPGEFEPHDYLLLACSGDHSHSKTISRIIREADGWIHPVVLVNDAFDRSQLLQDVSEHGIDIDKVTILCVEHDSKWCRDFGPTSLVSRDDVQLLDWTYSEERKHDDDVSMRLAALSKTSAQFMPLSFEGGNLLSNGHGLVLTSEKIVFQNREYEPHQTTAELRKQLGADQLLVLEPLSGEGTAHVDMFATFTSPNTVVVGSYDSHLDPVNADILNRNAEALSQVVTRHGRLNVVRIPMGSREGDCWRTYTNCIYANGVLIVPSYGESDDPKVLQEVVATYRRLLPGWKVSTIDSQSLIAEGGALRCASLNIKRLNFELKSTPEIEFPVEPGILGTPQLERVPAYGERNEWNFVDQNLSRRELRQHQP